MNHVDFRRYATALAFIWDLIYDISPEAWGGYGSQRPALVPASLQGAVSCEILSREGKYDVQQSQHRVHY